ncbi:CDK-activating kinase assembly factor MAT1 isoform X3 [Amborella trichopoda]|uniref:CDK-activating kinase assembly factor MAT1 isoform X3 n=2 Tax=Amborella trichopoda TaxID=13333 RepID=UPI0009BD3911|nr:CDK-activating kinase assembly factor MAT1 isoform X3 [Amborella trichopoda]|eukprot:XP_020528114.1 CDK-activating kinase assembly factor MAT1 isoform X3 [Amborella trichopoda]
MFISGDLNHKCCISPVATSTVFMSTTILISMAALILFNKRQEDFPSLREYNDYLEEVEDMTFNLVEGIDIPAIEAKIAKYQEENAEQIINSRARKAEELAAALRTNQGHSSQTDSIDATGAQNTQFAASMQGQYAPAMAGGGAFMQPRPMGTAPQPVPIKGIPDASMAEDEVTLKLRAERGARAGGWTVEISKRRAVMEAFGSLWL